MKKDLIPSKLVLGISFSILFLVAILIGLSASAQEAPVLAPHYSAASSFAEALALAAPGADDPKPPVIISTPAPKAPFVVVRWRSSYQLCCKPEGLAFYEAKERREALFLWNWSAARRPAGIIANADGSAIVWVVVEQ